MRLVGKGTSIVEAGGSVAKAAAVDGTGASAEDIVVKSSDTVLDCGMQAVQVEGEDKRKNRRGGRRGEDNRRERRSSSGKGICRGRRRS